MQCPLIAIHQTVTFAQAALEMHVDVFLILLIFVGPWLSTVTMLWPIRRDLWGRYFGRMWRVAGRRAGTGDWGHHAFIYQVLNLLYDVIDGCLESDRPSNRFLGKRVRCSCSFELHYIPAAWSLHRVVADWSNYALPPRSSKSKLSQQLVEQSNLVWRKYINREPLPFVDCEMLAFYHCRVQYLFRTSKSKQ